MPTRYRGVAEEIRALDVFIKLMRATNSVSARVDNHKTTGELSATQFGALEMIYHLGPVNQSEIGKKLLISKSNVVAVVDKLEADELVRRERSLEDRRCVFVHLTEKGRSLISALLPEHVAAITQEMHYLTPDELVELGRLCRKLGLGEKGSA